MTAPLCKECGTPVLRSSWTASFTGQRSKDAICMDCRRRHGLAAMRRKAANKRAFGDPKKK